MRKQPVGFATKGHGRKRRVYPIYRGYKGNPRGSGMQVSSVVEAQQLRTPMARRIDAKNKAPLAKTKEQWLSEPNRYDYPNIDTKNSVVVSPQPINSNSDTIKSEGKQMNTQTLTQQGVTFTAKIGQNQIVNEYGDKLPQVTDLTFNGETYNTGDIINVAPDSTSIFADEEQYKIERINQATNGNIVIVGRTARGSSDVFFPSKWNRITKQKFR